IAVVLTYIIPAGQFDRAEDPNTGKMAVIAGSYHSVEADPAGFGDFALSFDGGIKGSAAIISFLMLIGGAFGIVNSTGAIEALMAKFIVKFKSEGSKGILIAVLLLFFAICAGTFGMALEGLVFAPFLIVLMINMGYDAIVGISIPVIGSAIGYSSAYLNPFSLGIAQEIAGLPYTSGIGFRLGLFAIIFVITALYITRYAKKIAKDPEASLCTPGAFACDEVKNPEDVVFNKGQKRVLLIFVAAIAFLIYGTFFQGFFMAQCATVFLFMGFLAGLAYKMTPSQIAIEFVEGVKSMVMPCLVVGFARAITTILEDSLVMDTIIYYISLPLESFSPLISAPLMVVVQVIANFFINSGSAQAVVMMPL
ncbi:MAG: Na+/H+ antiporter NhaC family protein, partial [Clostridiales bacterium]